MRKLWGNRGFRLICNIGYAKELGEGEINEEIDTAYEYPVVPGTDEWRKLDSHIKKLNVCQIPEEILTNMTTEALVETVMNYPLLIDMLAYDTQLSGYQAIYKNFNGLRELQDRKDALEYLEKYIKNLNYTTDLEKYTDDDKLLMPLYAEGLTAGIKASIIENSKIGVLIDNMRYMIVPVSTPRGTYVSAFFDTQWSEAANTEAQLISAQNYYLNAYNVTLISPYNIKYNCHSYAWHSTASTNKYWINDPTAYMTDGSYYESIVAINARIYYDSPDGEDGLIHDHSGIVVSTGYSNNSDIYVYSKWGEHGVYKHTIYECPYVTNNQTIRYYMLNN